MKYFIYILIVFIFISCSNKNTEESWEQKTQNMVTKWNRKKIILPIKNQAVKGKPEYRHFFENLDSKIKIVTFIDANCSACLVSFDFWQDFINELNEKKLKCGFIPYIQIDDSTYFKNNFVKKINIKYTWIFDKDALFTKTNAIFDKRFQTALLDKNDKVIIIGNPTFNPELRKLYIDIITDINNK